MQDATDFNTELWHNFKAGHQEAFASLYNQYVGVLFSYGTKLSPDPDLVKDCIHEVFLDLYQHRQKLSETDNIRFYLFKSLKRTIFRKRKRNEKLNDIAQNIPFEFNTKYTIEQQLIETEKEESIKQQVATMLQSLTPYQREIIYLKFNMGFNYLEIAQMTGINHDSVKKQIYRILKKLRASAVGRITLQLLFTPLSFFQPAVKTQL